MELGVRIREIVVLPIVMCYSTHKDAHRLVWRVVLGLLLLSSLSVPIWVCSCCFVML